MLPVLIALFAGLVGVLLFVRRTAADIPPEAISMDRTLVGTFLPQSEIDTILQTSARYNVDARMLAAIRKAENGGPGREFGVTSVPAPDYQSQANVAAESIRNNQDRYEAEKGYASTTLDGRITDEFIAYMGARYAPIGAANDPTGLNANWVRNVQNFYRGISYA